LQASHPFVQLLLITRPSNHEPWGSDAKENTVQCVINPDLGRLINYRVCECIQIGVLFLDFQDLPAVMVKSDHQPGRRWSNWLIRQSYVVPPITLFYEYFGIIEFL
jgi:hypothetical protein